MSIALCLLSFFELFYMRRTGHFLLFVLIAGIIYVKNNQITEFYFWDLLLVIFLTTFVLNRLKINYKRL
jgi:hypothetical protein